MSSASSSIFRAARPAFRQGTIHAQARQAFRPRQQFNGSQGRRWQSGAADGAQQSWFKRMWESEVGIKTVHFWAPVMKWSLVLAGISDFARPAEKLSMSQNFALTCTGLIWTRWCFVIRPKNMLLAAVNFFLALVGITQLTRIGMYEMSKKEGAAAAIEDVKEGVKEEAAQAKAKVEEAIKN